MVDLRISFEDLFGKTNKVFSADERRERWREWKRAAIANGDQDVVDYWNDVIECGQCKYLNRDWCILHGLPASVNPILSFDHAIPGKACMGLGYEGEQLDIFESNK